MLSLPIAGGIREGDERKMSTPDHQGECYCIDCQKWKQVNEGFLLDNYDEDNVYTGKVWVCFECIGNG